MEQLLSFLGYKSVPYSWPMISSNPIRYNYLNAIKRNNEMGIFPLVKEEEKIISSVQRKILIAETELYTLSDPQKKEVQYKVLKRLREKLHNHYVRVRILKSSITESVEKAKIDFYMLNYLYIYSKTHYVVNHLLILDLILLKGHLLLH